MTKEQIIKRLSTAHLITVAADCCLSLPTLYKAKAGDMSKKTQHILSTYFGGK